MTAFVDRLEEARLRVPEVTPGDVEERLGGGLVLIDVRHDHEIVAGTIPGSLAVPWERLADEVADAAPDRDAEIVLFCATGRRSLLAGLELREMGYGRVASMSGGIVLWRIEGREVMLPEGSGPARYSRNLALPGIGWAGQERLAAARVLVIGAGGLGSPAALYLAAAGVGTIGIVDSDRVELSNLQRQVIHDTDRIGQPKVASAAAALRRLNPGVEAVPREEPLMAGNALDVMSDYDVVIDGSDNFPTRYLVNDASLHVRVPVVHASVYRWEGQVTVFDPYRGPCYRCLYPLPPEPGTVAGCAEGGVLGALTGAIGSLQVVEAIKILVGAGDALVGRLLIHDALSGESTTLRFERLRDCPACGDEARPPPLVDYDAWCRPL